MFAVIVITVVEMEHLLFDEQIYTSLKPKVVSSLRCKTKRLTFSVETRLLFTLAVSLKRSTVERLITFNTSCGWMASFAYCNMSPQGKRHDCAEAALPTREEIWQEAITA